MFDTVLNVPLNILQKKQILAGLNTHCYVFPMYLLENTLKNFKVRGY